MSHLELPKTFDEFVDARKASFLKVKELKGVLLCIVRKDKQLKKM